MSTKIAVNVGLIDAEYGVGSTWVDISELNDKLIFSAGSNVVIDGASLPSQSDLIQAGVILSGAEITVPKYFLADLSDNLLKEIHLAGNQNSQYVFAVVFDGATASEPVLEVWDDTDYDSVLIPELGAGTPASSWYRGITTTTNPAGVNWVGSRLAGSSSGHFLLLNDGNGALSVADTLYFQLKIVIPSTATIGGSAVPVIICKYLSV
jgi:hypothetical protein